MQMVKVAYCMQSSSPIICCIFIMMTENKQVVSCKDVERRLDFGWTMLFTRYSEKENSMMVEIVSLSIILGIRDPYGKTEKRFTSTHRHFNAIL